MVEEVILKNVVKLKLLVSMRIHPVVNISRVVRYRELIKKQKVKEPKSIEVNCYSTRMWTDFRVRVSGQE